MSSDFFPDPKPEKKIKEKYSGLKRSALKKKLQAKPTTEYKSTPDLIGELDSILSEFVRLLEADRHGIVKCFTCPNKGDWETMQNGHFVPRKHLSTRHEIKNCHPQCKYCNEGLAGNLSVYAIRLDEKYGDGTADELKAISKTICKRPAFEYEELIKTYTECVEKLKANLIKQ